jgi:hypothetical protein
MKVLSSVIVIVGLALPSVAALAADSPAPTGNKAAAAGSESKNSGSKKSGSKSTSAKGAAATPAASAAPLAPTVALEPDGVAFGMSADDVARLYDRWWDKQFIPRYQKANPGPKTRELDFELGEQKKVLRRIAVFDGRTTSFDKSEFHDEFSHGSGETMISSKLSRRASGEDRTVLGEKTGKQPKPIAYTRRFFFFQDKLWKVYDEYRLDESSPFSADFKEAAARVEASLGKSAKRTRAAESQFEAVAFDAGNTRVRVIKLPSDKLAIVRSDSTLTKEVLERRAQQAKTATSAGLDDEIQAVIR